MIEDAAFAQYETEGALPADRIEAVLSAIFYVLRLIAATQGIKPETIEKHAGDVYAVRPQKYVEPTEEELIARDNAETARQFKPFLERLIAEQKNREKSKPEKEE